MPLCRFARATAILPSSAYQLLPPFWYLLVCQYFITSRCCGLRLACLTHAGSCFNPCIHSKPNLCFLLYPQKHTRSASTRNVWLQVCVDYNNWCETGAHKAADEASFGDSQRDMERLSRCMKHIFSQAFPACGIVWHCTSKSSHLECHTAPFSGCLSLGKWGHAPARS
jgi:hypothetical protein